MPSKSTVQDAIGNLHGELTTRIRAESELRYAFNGAPVQITANSEATAQLIGGLQVTIASASPDRIYWVEFFCAAAKSPTPPNLLHVVLFENGTARGEIATVGAASGGAITVPIRTWTLRDSLSGSVTWSVCAWVDGGTGELNGEQGNAGQYTYMGLIAASHQRSTLVAA